MDTGLDALAVALYVTIDDLLSCHRERAPLRPPGGFTPKISDAELLRLAVMQSMLQFTSERRRLRHANTRLRQMFPYCTPVECGRSRETAHRSELAGWAEYGYSASHSRYFWGLRLHLVATLHGLPLGWALTGAKADERATFCDLLRPSRKGEKPRGGERFFKPSTSAHLRRSRCRLHRRPEAGGIHWPACFSARKNRSLLVLEEHTAR